MPRGRSGGVAIRAAGYRIGTERRPWLSPGPASVAHVGLGVLAVTALRSWPGSAAGGLLAGPAGSPRPVSRSSWSSGWLRGSPPAWRSSAGWCSPSPPGTLQQHPDASAWQVAPAVAFNVAGWSASAALGALLGAVGSALTLVTGPSAACCCWPRRCSSSWGPGSPGSRRGWPAPPSPCRPVLPGPAHGGARTARYCDRNTALLGALTFFLPCGFTQIVQVFALSTGRPATAAAVMALFALGTAPGLLGLGALTALARGRAAQTLFVVAGVAVLAFAFVDARAGLTNLGIRFGGGAPASTASRRCCRRPMSSMTGGAPAVSRHPGLRRLLAGEQRRLRGHAGPLGRAQHGAAVVPGGAARPRGRGTVRRCTDGDNVFELAPSSPGPSSTTARWGCTPVRSPPSPARPRPPPGMAARRRRPRPPVPHADPAAGARRRHPAVLAAWSPGRWGGPP